jgi:hypothetical protein
LVVKLEDGTRFEEPLQTPSDLHGWDAVAGKFREATRGVIDAAKSQSIIDQISKLESLASVRSLTDALRIELS